jgi:hypothetical protein
VECKDSEIRWKFCDEMKKVMKQVLGDLGEMIVAAQN